MRYLAILSLCMLICSYTYSQIRKGYVLENIEIFQGRKPAILLAGSEVRINQCSQDGVDLTLLPHSRYIKQNYEKETIVSYPLNVYCTYNNLEKIDFKVRAKNLEDFWIQQLKNSDAFQNLQKEGMQVRMREEMNQGAITSWKQFEKSNIFLEDTALDEYLTSLIKKMYPGQIAGRPGNLKVKAIKDWINGGPNAFAAPNGYICVNTWLLSILKNEEELMAILAHELTHYMLDHSLIEEVKKEKRQNRADATTLIVGTLFGIAESIDAEQTGREVDIQSIEEIFTATDSVAKGIVKNAYLKYSREMEYEADGVAAELLEFVGINPLAMSDALSALKNWKTEMGMYQSTTKMDDTHPALDDRIENIGPPRVRIDDQVYEGLCSRAFSRTIPIYLEMSDKSNALQLIEKNIKNKKTTSFDYYYKAKICISNNDNSEALKCLKIAEKELVDEMFDFYKLKANIYIKLKDYTNAVDAAKMHKKNMELLSISQFDYKENLEVINSEIKWSENLIDRLKD